MSNLLTVSCTIDRILKILFCLCGRILLATLFKFYINIYLYMYFEELILNNDNKQLNK